MPRGKIKKLVMDKGFGFIANETDKGQDIFFHASGVEGDSTFDELQEGQEVTYEMSSGDKGPRAVQVEAV